MDMDVKLLRAFIASPGGLEAERRAAFAAAQEVNQIVARPLGYRLELIGWEDTISGVGRPQALINADLETCDLFVGAMGATWGSQPSIDGPYTSGFEEEFELSRARHRASGSPVMSMYFKDIAAEQERDAGPALQKVQAFRQSLIDGKEFMYDKFVSPDEFAAKVRAFLSTQLIAHYRRDARTPRDDRPRTDDNQAVPEEEDAASGIIEPAEANFLDHVSSVIRSDGDGLRASEIARLRLIGAQFQQHGNDDAQIGVHDANLLYTERECFDLSFSERRALVGCGLIHIGAGNVPLWSWLKKLQEERPELLVAMTMFGSDRERNGAVIAMRLLGESRGDGEIVDLEMIQRRWWKKENSQDFKNAVLAYLAEFGTEADLVAVQGEADLNSNDTAGAAIAAAVQILLRNSPARAARYLLSMSFEELNKSTLRPTLDAFDELATDELERGVDHRSPDVRARTVTLLSERNALDSGMLGRALSDTSAIVRRAALGASDRLDQPMSLDEVSAVLIKPQRSLGMLFMNSGTDSVGEALFDAYRDDRLRRMPVAALRLLVANGAHREAAYLALAARRVDGFDVQLRSDIADGFAAYVAGRWPDGVKPARSAVGIALSGLSSPEQDKRRTLTTAALDVVANARQRADIALVRQALDSGASTLSEPVARYLRALGSWEDIIRLARAPRYVGLSLLTQQPTDLFNIAAVGILKLAGSRFADLLDAEMPEQMRARLIELSSTADFARATDVQILEALFATETELQRAAAMKTAAHLPRERVAAIFASYQADQRSAYYLVIHWLDLGIAYSRAAVRAIVKRANRGRF